MRFIPIFVAALLVLAACGAPATPPAARGEAAAESGPVSQAAPPSANGFIMSNAPPPEGAFERNGDGVKRDADGRPYNYALLGHKLPSFTAPMANGGTFGSDAIDRWTVVYVWGVWCGDCVAEGPYVAALVRAIAQDPDLGFISVHTPASPARTSPEDLFKKYGSLEAYFESVGYTLPVIFDNDASLRETLQISWTPSYLLVSPDGVVRGFRTDLSTDPKEPVKTFLRDIAEARRIAGGLPGPAVADVK